MNGALFAAFRVVKNTWNMIGCTRTTHSPIQKLLMCLFMIYFITMQIMSFFMVGSFYVAIKLFFVNSFAALAGKEEKLGHDNVFFRFFSGEADITFDIIFTYSYLVLIVYAILISLAVPIDRAMEYFRVIAVIFSALTVTSLMGITFFMF